MNHQEWKYKKLCFEDSKKKQEFLLLCLSFSLSFLPSFVILFFYIPPPPYLLILYFLLSHAISSNPLKRKNHSNPKTNKRKKDQNGGSSNGIEGSRGGLDYSLIKNSRCDLIIYHPLEWPSFTVQGAPLSASLRHPTDALSFSIHKLALETHISDYFHSYLMVADAVADYCRGRNQDWWQWKLCGSSG